jgi:O-acetyl-ADP-ribose deacetylase (regulator of RNase III)
MDAGVSRSIWLAGGRSIEKEARARVPVRPGRVAVTRAGDLAARFVFHAATNGSAMGEMILPSRDLVLEIMASCFYQADTFYVREIAFPLLATGLAAFRPDICLDAMFQFLARALLRGDTCVSDARIVLYRACPDYQVEVNGQTLELHHGNIARQKVDAIVNSIGQALTGGAVSGMIYHRGGHRIYDELRSKCPQGRPVAPVVLTAAGRLPAKYVIHTVCPDWRGGDHGEPELLAEAYRRSLKLAVGYGCASVAFPALSIGGWGYPLETASRVALATVIHYLRNSRDLKLVRFVLFSPAVYEAFVSALRELT